MLYIFIFLLLLLALLLLSPNWGTSNVSLCAAVVLSCCRALFLTGLHTCEDVFCVTCSVMVGWEYVSVGCLVCIKIDSVVLSALLISDGTFSQVFRFILPCIPRRTTPCSEYNTECTAVLLSLRLYIPQPVRSFFFCAYIGRGSSPMPPLWWCRAHTLCIYALSCPSTLQSST